MRKTLNIHLHERTNIKGEIDFFLVRFNTGMRK